MILNSHDSLTNYFMTNFNMMYRLGDKSGMNPLEWENQITPFERRIYLELLMQQLEKDQKANNQDMPELLKEPTREDYE